MWGWGKRVLKKTKQNFFKNQPLSVLSLFLVIALLFVSPAHCDAAIVSLDSQDARWITRMIFKNECNLRTECLTTWNEGEDFASLGIGHFIWYPKDRVGPFRESFPEFIVYLESMGRVLPEWLHEMVEIGMPWKSRDEFLRDQTGEAIIGLRAFLKETMTEQALFMIYRFKESIMQMVLMAEPEKKQVFFEKIFELAQTREGIYAMMDYSNFKGDGLSKEERYHSHGWGLFQVLQEMTWPAGEGGAEVEFVKSARKVLRRRVENAPAERLEERWIQGWENRVNTYSGSAKTFSFSSKQEALREPFDQKDSIEIINFAELAV